MHVADYRRELRELFRLAGPVALAQSGNQLMGLVDVAVLGRFGARELAASGIGNAVFFACSVVGIGIVLGIDPLIAQAVGAGDHNRARRALWQGVWLAIAMTAVLTVVLVAGASLIPLIGAPELTGEARAFLLVRTTSLLPLLLFFVLRSYLQAYGRTGPLVTAMVVANILNFGGDLLLIPPLGVAGAALPTPLCTLAGVPTRAVPPRALPAPRLRHRSHRHHP